MQVSPIWPSDRVPTPNDSGQDEVYIQPFLGPGGKLRIPQTAAASLSGARTAVRSSHLAPDHSLMAASVKLEGRGARLEHP